MSNVAPNSLANLNRGGRKPGTVDIKNMILKALTRVGGVDYLVRQAELNPIAFMGLIAKVMPTQVASSDGSPIHLHLLAAIEVSRETLARQQQQPAEPLTIEAEKPQEIPANLLDAPLPTE